MRSSRICHSPSDYAQYNTFLLIPKMRFNFFSYFKAFLSIHLLLVIWVVPIWGIVNRTVANMIWTIYFLIHVFVFLEDMPSNGVIESHGSSNFNFFKKSLYCFPERLNKPVFPPIVNKQGFHFHENICLRWILCILVCFITIV